MDVKQKIIDLYDRGIRLWEEDGNLHYRTIGDKLSLQDGEFLKKNKKNILEVLNGNTSFHKNRSGRYCSYPLTDIQAAYLLGRGEHFEYGGVSSHVYFEVEFPKLNRISVEKVWNILISRHENLRLVINKDQSQRVLENVPAYEVIWNDDEISEDIDSSNEIRRELENKYYEIEKWPMFDIGVSQLKDKSIMHLSFDFLILDWNSIWILLKEFEELYYENKMELEDIKYTFREYYMDRCQKKRCSKYIIDENYWKEKIKEYPQAPILPIISGEVKNEFQRLSSELEVKQWEKIKDMSLKAGLTPTITVLTAFSIALEPWCEKPDFTINLTTMNRDSSQEGIESVVGDFTSINLLNVEIAGKKSFFDNAVELQRKLAQNLEHNLFSGVEVLRELRRLHGGESYILPIVFTSSIGTINAEYNYLRLGSYGVSQTPQVFLDCQVMEVNKKLHINLDVRKGIFPDNMTEHIMVKFREVLIALAENYNWEKLLFESTLIKEEEEERNIVNKTECIFHIKPLHAKILEHIYMSPEDIAVIKGNDKTTYGELGRKISGICCELRKSGMKEDDKAAIIMKHSSDAAAAIIGVLNMGGTYIPIDYMQPEKRILSILNQADVHYVLTDNEMYVCKKEDVKVIVCNGLSNDIKVVYNEVNIDKPAYIIFTSGTTGLPKGVEITHRGANNTILAVNEKFHPQNKPVLLGLSKLNFDLSVYDIFGILSMGGTIVYPEEENRLDPSYWAKLISDYSINVWNTVPALMQLLISYCKEQADRINLELEIVLLSGDWIPVSLPECINQFAPDAEVISLGGATEASIWSIYHICDKDEKNRKSILYGIPLPNQKFYVLDSDLRDRPVWVPGELYIAGDGLAKGYFGDKEKTEESFLSHPITGERLYKTGDYGRYIPGGEIEFLGRKDNQVKINGFRIELEEIESALLRNVNISAASVVIDSENEEKKLIGFVCPGKRTTIEKDDTERLVCDILDYSQMYQKEIAATDIEIQSVLRKRDILAIKFIIEALEKTDILNHNDDEIEYILRNTSIAPEHRWIVYYWLSHLYRNGYFKKNENEQYVPADYALLEMNFSHLLENLKKEWGAYIGDIEFINYIDQAGKSIYECLERKADPVSILYPDGSSEFLEAIYEHNIFSQYFNHCIAEFICSIGMSSKRRFRILEVGAGTGTTSKMVLKLLKDFQITYEYYFTDIANSFIARAKTNLRDYSNVKFTVYDINEDFRKQGFIPNEFDVVLAVGVLENAKDIPRTMSYIKDLIRSNGWLLFTEPIKEEPWILATQIFMMERPADELRNNITYLSKESWEQLLKEQDDKGELVELPLCNDKAALGNMKLFAKQFHTSMEVLEEKEIFSSIKEYLPDYMIPRRLHILNQMPLNENGKVDRKKLTEYSRTVNDRKNTEFSQNEQESSSTDSELVLELCNIAAPIMGLQKIGSEQNLYDVGADSLLLAQISGKVRDYIVQQNFNCAVTFDMILKQLLNKPALKELAEYICDNSQEDEKKVKDIENQESIGRLTLYGGGEGPLRIVFHAGFGTVDVMKKVIDCLVQQNKGMVASITVNNISQYLTIPPEELVARISKAYAELILEYAPESVQLIGYCQGGLIALETASHVLNEGIEIVDISLIDSYSSPIKVEDALIAETIFLPNYSVSYEKIYPQIRDKQLIEVVEDIVKVSGKVIKENQLVDYILKSDSAEKDLKDLIKRLSELTEEQRFEEYAKAVTKELGKQVTKEILLNSYYVNMASWRGADMTPVPYLGDVRYFMAEEKMNYLFADTEENLLYWRNVCLGNFEVILIKGNHVSCVKGSKNAKEVAEKLELT